MRHTRSKSNSKKLSVITTAAGSAVFSCLSIGAVILLLGLIVARIDATNIILSAMSTFALCVGAFSGGYVSGKKRRRNGLLMGVLCGVFVFIIIVVISYFFSKSAESFSIPTKLILTLVCAGIGGVTGVNSKHSRF